MHFRHNEMKHAVTSMRSMNLNFPTCIERLFGELARDRASRRLDGIAP